DGGPVVTLFQAGREDADNALVPVRLEQTEAKRHVVQRQIFELRQGFALHALFDALAILVELIELQRHVTSQSLVVTKQTFDAQRHIVQAPRRVQPWPEDKAKIGGGDAFVVSPSDLENRAQTRPRPPGTDSRKALMHQNAVVGV